MGCLPQFVHRNRRGCACGWESAFRRVILHRKSRGCGVPSHRQQSTVLVSGSVSIFAREIIEKVVDVFECFLVIEFRDAITEVNPELVSDIFG